MPDMIEFERRTQTDKVSFFNADYRDGRVHIGGKAYLPEPLRHICSISIMKMIQPLELPFSSKTF